MNIKTYMALAVAALTAACTQAENVEVPADENAAAQIELNEDSTVNTSDKPRDRRERDMGGNK